MKPPATLADDALWSLKAIANFLGCSEDRVRQMARHGAPIHRPLRQTWFARKTALLAWLETDESR